VFKARISALVFFLVFIILPVICWYIFYVKPSQNVKGLSTTRLEGDGFLLDLKSELGSWNAYIFHCFTKEECVQSLTSGKQASVISGDITDSKLIKLSKDASLDGVKYLKIYVDAGLNSQSRIYKILYTSASSKILKFASGNSYIEALIVDLSKLEKGSGYIKAGAFSDK
jgi:hypothetical protein